MSALREALEDAFDHHEELAETGGTTEPADDGLGDGETVNEEVVEPTETPAKIAPAAKPGSKTLPKLDGKPGSAPKTGEQVPAAGKDQKVTPLGTPKPAATGPGATVPASTVRAPVTWRPELREKFATLPPEVQEEVTRREKDMTTFMEQTAGARNYAQSINQVIAPYEALIRAEGGNHITAVDSLFKTAYILRTAAPHTKAKMVAQMIKQHAVDPELLDQELAAILSGQPAQGGQGGAKFDPAMANFIQQQLAPVQQFMQTVSSRQQENEQRAAQESQASLKAFSEDPKNEYFEDVRGIMADLIDASAKAGQILSLQDAYTRATLAHPTIAPLVMRSRTADSAAQRSAAARRARNASASLPSGGAPAGETSEPKPKTIRGAVEAAWDAVEQRDVS